MSVYFLIYFKSVHNKRYLLFHIKNCICLENVYVQKCLNFIKFSLKWRWCWCWMRTSQTFLTWPAVARPEALGRMRNRWTAQSTADGPLSKPPNAQIETCKKQGTGSTLPNSIQESKKKNWSPHLTQHQEISAPHEQMNVFKTLVYLAKITAT